MPRPTTTPLTVCLALTMTCIVPGPVSAQPTGQLDPSFGSGGKEVLSWNTANHPIDEAMAVTSQADGKLVIIGRSWSPTDPATGFCTVVRTLVDGSVDTNFGTNGQVTVDFSPIYGLSYCNAVTIQSDAKILVTGGTQAGPNNESDFMVARLNLDGSLDASFGSGGKATLSYLSGSGTIEYAEEVLQQSDGKIILAGSIWWPGGTDRDSWPCDC